jgi:lipoate-protein ligase B
LNVGFWTIFECCDLLFGKSTVVDTFEPDAKCWWVNLPETEYQVALDLQLTIVNAKIADRNFPDVILCIEHPRVFTLGRRGGKENLCVSREFLSDKGVSVVPTDRGGNITYHGPGQLVVYPIIDLHRRQFKVVEFVSGLEQAMIRTASHWGIDAGTDPANRGVWLNRNKLGSIGITVRRGISFHGLALNVNTDMEPFAWINPCGLDEVRMTSFEKHLDRPVPMVEARRLMGEAFAEIFRVKVKEKPFERLKERLRHLEPFK